MGGPNIGQKGWKSFIHDNDHYLLVTKVKCKDLPDNDPGDFRCRLVMYGEQYTYSYTWGYIMDVVV